jgi:hypothetical protein
LDTHADISVGAINKKNQYRSISLLQKIAQLQQAALVQPTQSEIHQGSRQQPTWFNM